MARNGNSATNSVESFVWQSFLLHIWGVRFPLPALISYGRCTADAMTMSAVCYFGLFPPPASTPLLSTYLYNH